jgi:hypothetical protein
MFPLKTRVFCCPSPLTPVLTFQMKVVRALGRETGQPERVEKARSFPLRKAVMDRRTGSPFSGQGMLLASSAQQRDHRLTRLTIGHARAPSFGVRGSRRDQGFDLFPQRVTDFPRMRSCHACFLSLVSFRLPGVKCAKLI